MAFLNYIYGIFGLEAEFKVTCRPKDAKLRRAGTDAQWDYAEKEFMAGADEAGREYSITEDDKDDVAPVGPKIEALLTDGSGQKWTCGSLSIDFESPVRFNL